MSSGFLKLPALLLLLIACATSNAADPLSSTDDAAVLSRLTELGAQVTQTENVVTKLSFKDCSKLGAAEFRLIGQLKELKSLTLYGQCKGLTDETLPLLSGLSKLEELGTDGIQVTDAGLAKLIALKSFFDFKT